MARKRVIDVTANTTLSKNQSGSLVVLDKAEGLTVTLPEPGRGLEYDFVVKTAITHGTAGYVITVPSTTTASMRGCVVSGAHNGNPKNQASSAAEKINTSSAKGGLVGSYYKLVCNNDGIWEVTGVAVGSGDATVFA